MGTIITQLRGEDVLWNFTHTFAAAHFYFTAACPRRGGHSLACRHWRQLYETHPTIRIFVDGYEEVATRHLKLEDWERTVMALKELVNSSLKEQWYRDELRRALMKDGPESAIAI